MRGIVKPRRVEYFKTAEVAELIGVTKQTVLNWLKQGLITEPERNPATGYRLWTEKDIERVRRFLRERAS
jgi:DNA-binding transcriptional MerR regulator